MPTTYTIIKGGQYFNTVLYSGNSTARTITGVGFQPDFNWTKPRNAVGSHVLTDSVRGVTKFLETNSDGVEQTGSTGVQSWNSDGYALGTGNDWNISGETFASWNWRASNASAVTNTAGTITSSVSANTTSGFSVVTYTGNGSAGATVGHGITAAPKMIIIKARDGSGYAWKVYVGALGSGSHLELNSTSAAQGGIWNGTNPSSTVFTLGTNAGVNENGKTYVAYCFAEINGYSKFGSYTGNGSTDGPFVYTGFRPAFVLTKCSSTTGNWMITDDARNPSNLADLILMPNNSDTEYSQDGIDMLSNGFKMRASTNNRNANGGTYIYMAFAEMPTKYANAR